MKKVLKALTAIVIFANLGLAQDGKRVYTGFRLGGSVGNVILIE